jgi:phosphocarrier protein
MLSREITIVNRLGLHARAAAKFVNLASGFDSEINLSRNGHSVNGKSIMGVMMLAAAKGATLELSAQGDDEENALQQLEALVARRFDEEE